MALPHKAVEGEPVAPHDVPDAWGTSHAVAFALVRRLDPTSRRLLRHLLAKRAAVKVSVPHQDTARRSNTIFVIPPKRGLSVNPGKSRIPPISPDRPARPPPGSAKWMENPRAYAKALIDTVDNPLAVFDEDLTLLAANAPFYAALGVTTDVADRQRFERLPLGLATHKKVHGLLIRLLRQPPSGSAPEIDVEDMSTGYRVWSARAQHTRPISGQPSLILLALRDVTNERCIARQQLQMMINAVPGATIAVDSEGRIRFVSPRVEAVFGYRAEELIGATIDRLLPNPERERHGQAHAAFVARPESRPMAPEGEVVGLTRDGREIPLDITLTPVPTPDGLLVLAAIHDLRRQKRDEARLREAIAAADRANHSKSRFLAAASHDLRQPLQTIVLLLGVLLKRAADLEARTIVGKLEDAVSGMSGVLDTLLDINLIENGSIVPDITEFPISDLLARAADTFGPLSAAKGLTLRVVQSSCLIRSDRRLLERMLGNLLSNAIKYTDQGRVLLGCRRRGNRLAVEVWDTGLGIPAESLDAVFEEFHRLDPGDATRFGLGIGLYVVRRFAELLAHPVEVRSQPGEGTVFALLVPACRPPSPWRALTSAAAAQTGRPAPLVLLIEDDPVQLDTLRLLLELEGYRVLSARTGAEALAMARRDRDESPSLVVADHNLHGSVSGLQVIDQLSREYGRRVPALIVSGDKTAEALRLFADSGHRFIGKPVKAYELLAAVSELAQAQQSGGPSRHARHLAMTMQPASTSGALIGVIDDDTGVRDAVRMILEADGRTVATYASGEAFFSDPTHHTHRCLIVDVGLPGMDGLALQGRLRAVHAEVPIIFMSGSDDLPHAVQAMRDGAADFLQKPIRPRDLCASVARALIGFEQAARDHVAHQEIDKRLATLTERERQVMGRIVTGAANKVIAADLGISQRTVEHHRQSVMRKTASRSLAALVRMVGSREGPAAPSAAT